eukprot:Nk52_evm5s1129 gene=Nk52_evmTU5s1129
MADTEKVQADSNASPAGNDVTGVLKELVSFMLDENPKVAMVALSNVFQLTGSPDGRKALLSVKEDLLKNIIKCLIEAKRANVKYDCLGALVNLSIEDVYALELIDHREVFDIIMAIITNEIDPDADLAGALLRNLTRLEKGCIKLLRVREGDLEGKDVVRLLSCFVNEKYNKVKCTLDHLASVFGNIAQLPVGRKIIMKREGSIFQKLLPFTSHVSETRREGVAAMLRNCTFDETRHEWLLSDEVDLLTYLLLPLAGPEELDDDDMEKLPDALQYLPEDKAREANENIRLMLLEGVYQLCTTKRGRIYLQDKNCYVIIRELHKWEKSEECDAVICNLVDLLMGDPIHHDNLKEVDVPEEFIKKLEIANNGSEEEEQTKNTETQKEDPAASKPE